MAKVSVIKFQREDSQVQPKRSAVSINASPSDRVQLGRILSQKVGALLSSTIRILRGALSEPRAYVAD